MLARLLSVLFFFSVVTANTQGLPAITGSKIKKADAEAALLFHNKIRKDVGVPALTWSAPLAGFAQAWADELVTTGCKLKHRPYSGAWSQKFGENIYYSMSPGANSLMASTAWYSEIKDFTHGKLEMKNISKTGHYTQMVWKSTTMLGIGIAKCPSGATIIVANYDPQGNYLGEKPY